MLPTGIKFVVDIVYLHIYAGCEVHSASYPFFGVVSLGSKAPGT
jgi:hypothetical protein